MENEFLKVVCIDEGDPMEYKILEEANRANLAEVHGFLQENFYRHKGPGIRWLLLQGNVKYSNTK